MGFFKPAGDDATEDGALAEGDSTDEEQAGDAGGPSASAEGEGRGALEDLGIDLDAGAGLDEGPAADF